jgi:hypothetical protein
MKGVSRRIYPALFLIMLCLWRLVGALHAQSRLPTSSAAYADPAAGSTSRRSVIEIELCLVGNPGNQPDPAAKTPTTPLAQLFNRLICNPPPPTEYGRVAYSYAIGKYDVTVAQYKGFLNAVARTDQYGLYTWKMSAVGKTPLSRGTGAGIQRSGAAGSYTYSVMGNSGSYPIAFISWFDAARFCNWLPTRAGLPASNNFGIVCL